MKVKRITAFISAILMCSSMISMSITGTSAEEISSEEMISEEPVSEESVSEDEISEETISEELIPEESVSEYEMSAEPISDLKMSETITSFAPFVYLRTEDCQENYQERMNVALSYKNDLLNGGFFGYAMTSKFIERIDKCPFFILYLVDEYSYLDTFEIDEGYTLDDILYSNGSMKTNHFKATGDWYGFEWVYDHGVLTISGDGDIPDICEMDEHRMGFHYTGSSYTYRKYPWSNFKCVNEVIFEDGVRNIPWQCIGRGSNVEKIVLGSDVVINEEIIESDWPNFVDSLDVYCSETTQISWEHIPLIRERDITIHGYTNSPVDYAIQKLKEESSEYDGDYVDEWCSTVVFESIGTIETDITTEPSTTQEIKLGDANLDGEINIADAVFINKYLVDAVQLSDESRTASDCDKDGSVTSADALVILKYLVGTIDTIE